MSKVRDRSAKQGNEQNSTASTHAPSWPGKKAPCREHLQVPHTKCSGCHWGHTSQPQKKESPRARTCLLMALITCPMIGSPQPPHFGANVSTKHFLCAKIDSVTRGEAAVPRCGTCSKQIRPRLPPRAIRPRSPFRTPCSQDMSDATACQRHSGRYQLYPRRTRSRETSLKRYANNPRHAI